MPTQTTNFTLAAGDWTQISDGSTPVVIRNSSAAAACLYVSAAKPDAGLIGTILRLDHEPFVSTTATPVWGRALRETATVDVTPEAASGSGGSGGATTIPDGADVTDGARSDAAWDGAAASASIVSILKACWGRLAAIANALGQALPLPTGAATAAKQDASAAKLDQLHADMLAATPAGANVIGKVGIDQTTPGVTNKVAIGSTVTVDEGLTTGAAAGATVATGGTGYAVGNTITLADGTILTVATIAGSAVATVTVTTAPSVTAVPANPVAQTATNGSGTGATFTMVYAPNVKALFGAAAPNNGWKVTNSDSTYGLWANDNANPAASDGFTIAAGGGQYATELGEKPAGIVRIIGQTIGQKYKARAW